MTKQENLDSLQKDADKALAANSPKVKRRRMIFAAILAIGSIVGIGVGIAGTNGEKDRAYSAYVEGLNAGEYASVAFEFLDYRDTFELWNDSAIGNDVNALLDGGELYSRNDIEIYPDNSYQAWICDADEMTHVIADRMSYINVWNRSVFYRSEADRSIYRYDLDTQQVTTVFQGNVGEVFITNDTIYCIDYSQNSAVISLDLQGGNQAVVVDKPVSSFIVCGDTILYLDTVQRLYSMTLGSDASSLIVSDIERFFVNGKIYAESKNTIFCFTPSGDRAEEVYTSVDDSLRMVSVIDEVVFFQENRELHSFVDGTTNTISASQHDLFSCLVKCTDGSLKVLSYDKGDSGIKQDVLVFAMVSTEEGS